MSSSLATAQSLLLTPAHLSLDQLASTLGGLTSRGVEFADLYFEHHKSESWSLEESIVKSGSFSIESGVGVRAINGEQTAFAYSGDIGLASISKAVDTVAAIGRAGQSASVAVNAARVAPTLYTAADPLASISDDAKIALLRETEALPVRATRA